MTIQINFLSNRRQLRPITYTIPRHNQPINETKRSYSSIIIGRNRRTTQIHMTKSSQQLSYRARTTFLNRVISTIIIKTLMFPSIRINRIQRQTRNLTQPTSTNLNFTLSFLKSTSTRILRILINIMMRKTRRITKMFLTPCLRRRPSNIRVNIKSINSNNNNRKFSLRQLPYKPHPPSHQQSQTI